jgi:hypothetical protein
VVLSTVVEKCLPATRAGTKLKGVEVLLLFIEFEDAAAVLVRSQGFWLNCDRIN